MSAIKLYRHPLSGHAHRVELLLSMLNINAEIIDVDLLAGEHKSPEFLKKNPNGVVPVLEDNGTYFYESTAILVYLASKYDPARRWYPIGPEVQAEIQQILAMASGPLAAGPGAARLITLFGADLDPETTIAAAHGVLSTLEQRLQNKEWLAGHHATIADLAAYAYIAHAPEGNVTLEAYPLLRSWLARVEALPGFIPMQKSAVGLAA